jgi:hypothetical protein
MHLGSQHALFWQVQRATPKPQITRQPSAFRKQRQQQQKITCMYHRSASDACVPQQHSCTSLDSWHSIRLAQAPNATSTKRYKQVVSLLSNSSPACTSSAGDACLSPAALSGSCTAPAQRSKLHRVTPCLPQSSRQHGQRPRGSHPSRLARNLGSRLRCQQQRALHLTHPGRRCCCVRA